ncbi:MAG: hypothetical protein JSR39_02450 [Verrucomicrobia bacterium]|nr:hypothetical protein [Verrucomicrobiota bacterium]
MKTLFLSLSLAINVLCCAANVDWIDIPRADYHVILASEEPEIEPLDQLIAYYHSLDKSSLKSQSDRIAYLEAISCYLEQMEAQEKFADQRPTILLLNKTVQSKKNYLEQLLKIPSDEEIASYHFDDSSLLSAHFEPLFLRNNITYSLRMKEFWGKFWLESIDPCHRRLANYYQFWIDTRPPRTDYQSFFLWLESQPIPKNVPVVDYYSDEKLEACRIEISDGYLRKSDTHELVSTDKSKRNLFVIDLLKELYLEPFKEGVWHTSLSRGKPILGAGLLQSEEGVVKTVAFECGHYLPSLEQSFQSLQVLRERGVRFKKPFQVVYFENRNKYKILISENVLEDYQQFNDAIHDLSKRKLVSSNEF